KLDRWKERCLGHTHSSGFDLETLLGLDDVRTALQQRRRQSRGDLRRCAHGRAGGHGEVFRWLSAENGERMFDLRALADYGLEFRFHIRQFSPGASDTTSLINPAW